MSQGWFVGSWCGVADSIRGGYLCLCLLCSDPTHHIQPGDKCRLKTWQTWRKWDLLSLLDCGLGGIPIQRNGEVCAFDFQCWSVFLRWHLFVSQQVFFMMQIHKCCHVCVPFVKQLHCIKQPHRRCLCGLCIWIDSFFSSVANIVLYAGRQTANPICLQSQQTASKAT